MPSPSFTLTLFFTYGLSLKTWEQIGILERELALYRRFQDRGVQINLVTYGADDARLYADRLPDITILDRPWWLPKRIYNVALPYVHKEHLAKSDIIKTNQMNGGLAAYRASKKYKRTLFARCGYMWSNVLAKQFGSWHPLTLRAIYIEKKVFPNADEIIVTAPHMADDLRLHLPHCANRINIIPNYVDTALFVPGQSQEGLRTDIIYVGRLHPEKNVASLVEALSQSAATATIIGEGELGSSLRRTYADLDGRLTWIDHVPHEQLPQYLNSAKVFVLPSFYEGHPKALIEAMSCGLAVIGADSPGIRELITHGENGWLCETSADSLLGALNTLLGNEGLRQKLGKNAHDKVVKSLSLDVIAAQEYDLMIKNL
jgi:glycosyltransferase involved in cell wall biosynthesis